MQNENNGDLEDIVIEGLPKIDEVPEIDTYKPYRYQEDSIILMKKIMEKRELKAAVNGEAINLQEKMDNNITLISKQISRF